MQDKYECHTYRTQILSQAEFQPLEDQTYLPLDGILHHVATCKWWGANPGVCEPLCSHPEPPFSLAWTVNKHKVLKFLLRQQIIYN